MASERDNGFGNAAVGLIINLVALGLSAGIVALIVATIVVEID